MRERNQRQILYCLDVLSLRGIARRHRDLELAFSVLRVDKAWRLGITLGNEVGLFESPNRGGICRISVPEGDLIVTNVAGIENIGDRAV